MPKEESPVNSSQTGMVPVMDGAEQVYLNVPAKENLQVKLTAGIGSTDVQIPTEETWLSPADSLGYTAPNKFGLNPFLDVSLFLETDLMGSSYTNLEKLLYRVEKNLLSLADERDDAYDHYFPSVPSASNSEHSVVFTIEDTDTLDSETVHKVSLKEMILYVNDGASEPTEAGGSTYEIKNKPVQCWLKGKGFTFGESRPEKIALFVGKFNQVYENLVGKQYPLVHQGHGAGLF